MERATTGSVRGLVPRPLALLLLTLLTACPDSGGGGGGGGAGFAIQTTSGAFGIVGQIYSTTLTTAGGTAPFTWSIASGSLPSGLTLNPATGQVTGTPTAPAGTSTPTIRSQDATGQTATQVVTFAIHPVTDRVSVDSGGIAGNGLSLSPAISDNGRFVAFASTSTNLVSGVALAGQQIYLHDRQTNQITLVSRRGIGSGVVGGNGTSSAPSISTDGQFVAFASTSTDLLASGNPGGGAQHIYLFDRLASQVTLISKNSLGVAGDGPSDSPSISKTTGQFITFVSTSTNLLAPAPATAGQQVFLHDRLTGSGVTSLVSKDNNPAGNSGNGTSSAPSISANGQFVAFTSTSTNLLAPAPAVAGQQIYVHDRLAGTGLTGLVSKDNNAPANSGNAASTAPSISGDGQWVSFVSTSTNLLAPGPATAGQQVFLHDRLTGLGVTSLVSKNDLGVAGDAASDAPSTNINGAFVAFASLAQNLVSIVAPQQIYVRALP